MAMLITVIGVEVVALLLLWGAVRKRKHKIARWILGIPAVILQGSFWYLAIHYQTIFIIAEILLDVAVIVWGIYTIVFGSKTKGEKTNKEEMVEKILTLIVISGGVGGVFCLVGSIISYPIENSEAKWIEEFTVEQKENIQDRVPPKIANEFEVEFVCIHNSHERRYDLYCTWEAGIYKIASYGENECEVLIVKDKKKDVPNLLKKVKKFAKYNTFFENYEEPTLLETMEEAFYTIYVPEKAYKEDYTD